MTPTTGSKPMYRMVIDSIDGDLCKASTDDQAVSVTMRRAKDSSPWPAHGEVGTIDLRHGTFSPYDGFRGDVSLRASRTNSNRTASPSLTPKQKRKAARPSWRR